jgi:hypothetical protein
MKVWKVPKAGKEYESLKNFPMGKIVVLQWKRIFFVFISFSFATPVAYLQLRTNNQLPLACWQKKTVCSTN